MVYLTTYVLNSFSVLESIWKCIKILPNKQKIVLVVHVYGTGFNESSVVLIIWALALLLLTK